jgi:hypothetical protein
VPFFLSFCSNNFNAYSIGFLYFFSI